MLRATLTDPAKGPDPQNNRQNAGRRGKSRPHRPRKRGRCRGTKSDSKSRGYVRGGKALATVKLYIRVYEFRPLSEEVKALRLGALRRSTEIWVCVTRGANPCPKGGSGLYRVCQDPSPPLLQGFNVHKDRALLITPAIK